MRTTFLLVAVLSSLLPLQASAQDEAAASPVFGGAVDANRAFLWRGLEVNRGLLLQPSAWASFHGWSAEIWGNLVAHEARPEAGRGLTEVDGIFSRQAALGGISIEATLTGYYFPELPATSTAEIGLCLSRGLGPFGLRASGALDVAEYGGSLYGEIGIDWERALGGGLSFFAGGSQGVASSKFNRSYLGLDRASLGPLRLAAGLGLRLAGSLKVRPHAEWSRAMDPDVGDIMPDGQFNVGVALELGG